VFQKYDAIIVGAGIGGLVCGTLLALEGLKTLIVEKNDRVGGRAMSISGDEITEKGLEWYESMLSGQYTYLAQSNPGISKIIEREMLNGYKLDIGFHSVATSGRGFFHDFEDIIGGLPGSNIIGHHHYTYNNKKFYKDPFLGKYNRNYIELIAKERINIFRYYGFWSKFSNEELSTLEKKSFYDWAKEHNFFGNGVIWNNIKSFASLFSTINNPHQISAGAIFKWMKYAIDPKISNGSLKYPAGFSEGGMQTWVNAVAEKFKNLGGNLLLFSAAREIRIEDGRVKGVEVERTDGEIDVFPTETAVSNVPIQDSFAILNKRHFPEKWVKSVKRVEGAASYTPYFGLKKLPMSNRQALMGVKNTCFLPKEEGFDWDLFICWNVQSAVDPSVAPEGKFLLSSYIPITEKESLSPKLIKKLIARFPEFMEEIYPGFKDCVEWALHPVSTKLEGAAKTIHQAGNYNFPSRSKHVYGLYFTGDTAEGFGVAMDSACLSGMICAGEIVGKEFTAATN